MAHILVVDDDAALRSLLSDLLRDRGHEPECTATGASALAAVERRRPHLVLLDLHLPGAAELLARFRSRFPGVPVAVMSGQGDIGEAVAAMKAGAVDFIRKPFDNSRLLDDLHELLALQRGLSDTARPAVVGFSACFRAAMELAGTFAVPDISLLILGETGTGKELAARSVHASSKRAAGAFVPVDCSVLPESLLESELFGHDKGAFTDAHEARIGRLEEAQGGTLFLDEIGNLSPTVQAKLLRVLQERRMHRVGGRETVRLDVRVVAATNADPREAVRAGRFRQDLYYRLAEVTVTLPPLRERQGDVPLLADHFVRVWAKRFGRPAHSISPQALELLERYPWPGNVRELENAIKAAVVLSGEVIGPEHLPAEVREHAAAHLPGDGAPDAEIDRILGAGIDLKAYTAQAAERAERALLTELVSKCSCSAAELARKLGVDEKTLRAKLRKYGLKLR